MSIRPIKILIVDDSRLMRKAVRSILEDNLLDVVGEAENGFVALSMLQKLNPDVIILDVNMPVMDGLTTLKYMMIQKPIPTIMLSSLTRHGASVTFDSLRYGAVDFVTKPSSLENNDIGTQSMEIISKVRAASEVTIEKVRYVRVNTTENNVNEQGTGKPVKLIAIGAAEGGYGTLLKLIPQLSVDIGVAYLVVLHVDKKQVDAFAKYLSQYSLLAIKRAVEGLSVVGGVCYLCSGDEYSTLREVNSHLFFHISPAPFASRRGAVNMLMFSVAEHAGDNAVGVILSGSDDDGAEGVCEIMASGGTAIVQRPSSCLYKKMSESALARCDASFIVSDNKIASAINICCI